MNRLRAIHDPPSPMCKICRSRCTIAARGGGLLLHPLLCKMGFIFAPNLVQDACKCERGTSKRSLETRRQGRYEKNNKNCIYPFFILRFLCLIICKNLFIRSYWTDRTDQSSISYLHISYIPYIYLHISYIPYIISPYIISPYLSVAYVAIHKQNLAL